MKIGWVYVKQNDHFECRRLTMTRPRIGNERRSLKELGSRDQMRKKESAIGE